MSLMKKHSLTEKLKKLQSELDRSNDDSHLVNLLINFSESVVDECRKLTEENKELKNIISKLKGEQSTPTIRKQTKGSGGDGDHSSENDRNKNKSRKKRGKGKNGSKRSRVKVDETIYLTMSWDELPSDATKQGVREKLSQDITITTYNTLFKRQMYFSPSENKSYLAPLPPGYEGGYGPNIKAWANALYSKGQMTIDKITWVFKTAGSIITNPTLHGFIMSTEESMSEQKIAIIKSGLASTSYQHLDDTSAREKGKNRFVNTLGNDYYSAYFTLSGKDRLSIIEMLSLDKMRFYVNEESFSLAATMGLPEKYIRELRKYASLEYLTRNNINAILDKLLPDKSKYKKHRKSILEATAIAAYQKGPYAIKQLIVDDAPQFKLITEELGLCWVHEGRHYKKMKPVFAKNTKILDKFIDNFWVYYHKLLRYKENSTKSVAKLLKEEFVSLFSQITGYAKLDKQLVLTLKKKDALLLVLKYPHIPPHNNPAELMARYQARSRDIHLHTMSTQGTNAKDSLATVAGTSDKLSVNLFHYLYDIITKQFKMTSLAELITIRANTEDPMPDLS